MAWHRRPGVHASLHRDYLLVTAAFIRISASVVCFNAATDADAHRWTRGSP